jgi:hypothetical protein
MSFTTFLSMFIIVLGGGVVARIMFTPLTASEAEIGVVCCIGLIGVASWLIKQH